MNFKQILIFRPKFTSCIFNCSSLCIYFGLVEFPASKVQVQSALHLNTGSGTLLFGHHCVHWEKKLDLEQKTSFSDTSVTSWLDWTKTLMALGFHFRCNSFNSAYLFWRSRGKFARNLIFTRLTWRSEGWLPVRWSERYFLSGRRWEADTFPSSSSTGISPQVQKATEYHGDTTGWRWRGLVGRNALMHQVGHRASRNLTSKLSLLYLTILKPKLLTFDPVLETPWGTNLDALAYIWIPGHHHRITKNTLTNLFGFFCYFLVNFSGINAAGHPFLQEKKKVCWALFKGLNL